MPGNLDRHPCALTITANNQTMVLHTTVPTLTATYTGLVNGDTASSLTTPPTLTTTAHSNSPISGNPYPITVSGAADTDYSISYVNGTLTVINQPATSVTMTVSPSLTSIYGQDVTSTAVVTATGDEGPTPTGTVQFQVDGSSFGSPVTMVNGSAAIDLGTGLQVGTHTITAFYSGDHNYASNSQYSIQTVTPAALTITTLSNTKPYGAATADACRVLHGLRQWRHQRKLDRPAGSEHHCHRSQPCLGGPVHDHRQRGGRYRLHNQLRFWSVDSHAGGALHHRQQPDQGVRRSDADPDRHIQRLRQWRQLGQPDDSAHAHDHSHRR